MSLPRRLRDDPAAGPWLAEHVRKPLRVEPLSPAVRARVGQTLAERLQDRTRLRLLAWPLAAAFLAGASFMVIGPDSLAASGRYGGRAHVQPRREPSTAQTAVPADRAGALTAQPGVPQSTPAASSDEPQRTPAAERSATRARAPRKARNAKQVAPAPDWLAQARAALASDPARTLALIHAHREPGRPVSPEVVELTILALEAQRARDERAAAEP